MPFLGILEDRRLTQVPGSVILEEVTGISEGITASFKHGTGRNTHIVLVPQPSDDPNDPLNWPYWKKHTVLGITCFGAILYAAVVSAMLNPAFYAIAIDIDSTVADIVLTTGYQTLVVGVTGPIFSAISRRWGKRPVFLFGSVICLVADIVGAALPTYNGILVSRILQGFAIAPYESIIFTLISDLFFVHERGLYASWLNFILVGISKLTSVVSGPIANQLGWRYTFYFLVLFGGIQTILQFLFVPETSYNRDLRYEIDQVFDKTMVDLNVFEIEEMNATGPTLSGTHNENATVQSDTRFKKKTWTQELVVFTGTYTNENIIQLLISPFAVVTNLAVSWILLLNSMSFVLYVVIAYVLSQLFAAPPYLLNPQSIGYLSLGPFIGSILGSLILGALSDPFIKWCSRRNNGVYEPEYRLVPCVLGVCSGAGLLGFGMLVSQGASPYAAATMYGLMLFGVMFICTGTASYALDAYRNMSNEIFIASMTVKNLILFGFSYFVNNWTAKAGPKYVFIVWGSIAFALLATLPVMFFYGKRYRSYWSRNNLLEKMHIRTHEE